MQLFWKEKQGFVEGLLEGFVCQLKNDNRFFADFGEIWKKIIWT